MIAFLPVLILGVPLVLALIDLMATRSGASDVEYDAVRSGRYGSMRGELRRGEESSPIAGHVHVPVRENSPANMP